MEAQLGLTPSGLTDMATKGYSELNVSPVAIQQDTTLTTSLEHLANGMLEVGSSYFLEIPATSSLEVYAYPDVTTKTYVDTGDTSVRSYVDTKLSGAAQSAYVGTTESTASTSFVDLATTTDQVTVTVGASGMVQVFLKCNLQHNTSGGVAVVGFAVSGANNLVPLGGSLAGMDIMYQAAGINYSAYFGAPFLVTGLTPGSTTFKMKYQVNTGTGTFFERRIAVIPL